MILSSCTLKRHEANTASKYPLPTCSLNYLETKPTTYQQAYPYKEWQDAMRDEIHALHINQTWSLVPLPTKCNLAGNKWVYRLLAKGYSQKARMDFYKTFSPVIKSTTIRSILVLPMHYQWRLK